ncbi:MAG TPA: hypothetical protein PLL10_00560 [Elusimicrobiales bacterium]|nr:hypothetical protein [Elusimicrobiales bacterium]
MKERLGHARFSVEGKTALGVLEAMAGHHEYGSSFREEVYTPGKPAKPYCIFMLNGHVLDAKTLGKVSVRDGDLLHIMAPVGGG